MQGYLGETPIETPDRSELDWIMYWMTRYYGIDGSRHKDWLLDQIARIRFGTPIISVVAKWDNGHEEIRRTLGEPTEAYHAWVLEMLGEYDPETEEYEYDYDPGTAP